MISSSDRSGWFGASDTATIMGNWHTKTFARFWLEKNGALRNTYTSSAMMAGTHYEHKILDHLGVVKRDRQIKIRPLRLRVNLDGETDTIHEAKTYSSDAFRVSKAYWQQAQVQMFAANKPLVIVAYRMTDDDYINYFNLVDPSRISIHPIERDQGWVDGEYLPRLRYLSECLRRHHVPSLSEVQP